MTAFFKNESFQFAAEGVLGATYHQASDAGEVLATIGRIPNGDADAWVREWGATGDRLARPAGEAEAAGHLRSASARWLRAASYYSEASTWPTPPGRSRSPGSAIGPPGIASST